MNLQFMLAYLCFLSNPWQYVEYEFEGFRSFNPFAPAYPEYASATAEGYEEIEGTNCVDKTLVPRSGDAPS